MPTVPLIEKSVETRPLNAPTLGVSLRPLDNPHVSTRSGERLGNALTDIADQMKKRADETALLEVQKRMDDWEASNLFDPKSGALAQKGKNAFGLPVTLTKKYGEDMNEIYQGLANDDQRNAFDKMALSRRDNIMRTLYSHERQEMDGFRKVTAEAASDSAVQRAALNYNNPAVREASIKTAKDSVASYLTERGITGEALDNELRKVEGKAHVTILTRMADDNPKAAIDYYHANMDKFGDQILTAQRLIAPTERKYKASNMAKDVLTNAAPKMTRDAQIDFVMNDLEGGDKLVQDGKGKAKFGLNSQWNPELDVPNLTADQAREAYKSKYWKWTGADDMAPDFALVAFDASVQHGMDDHTRKMIDDAKGDPQKLLEIRAAYYAQLAADPKKPENARQFNGWMNRLGKVQAQLDLMRGQLPDETTLDARVDSMTDDIELASDVKQIVSKQITDIKQARTAAETGAAREVSRYEANNMPAPPSLIARMSPEQQKAYYSKNYDPAEYERVRRQVAYGVPVDLEAVRFRVPPAQLDDLVKMQGDPVAQDIARLVDKRVDDSAQKVVGKVVNKIKTKEDFEKLQNFRQLVYNGVDSFERQNKKKPGKDDINKIVDELIIQPSGGGWFGGPEAVQFEGIPGDRAFMVGGEESSREQIVALASKHARAMNIPVTPENLASIFKAWKAKGLVVEQYARQ